MALRDKIRILDVLPGKEEDDIECDIRVAALGDGVQYEALSYIWGDRVDRKIVRVAGHEIEVTDNLYSALRYLRSSTSKRALWIDQLCIYIDRYRKEYCRNLKAEPLFSEGFHFTKSG